MDPAEKLLYDIFSNNHMKEDKMKTEKYARKPFFVEAAQVTAENMTDVAEWCKGEIQGEGDSKHIKVKVNNPLSPRQTKAFPSDWVLLAGKGFKVYTNKAFEMNFDPTASEEPSPIDFGAGPASDDSVDDDAQELMTTTVPAELDPNGEDELDKLDAGVVEDDVDSELEKLANES